MDDFFFSWYKEENSVDVDSSDINNSIYFVAEKVKWDTDTISTLA